MANKNAFAALTNMNAAAHQSEKLIIQLNQEIQKFLPKLNNYLGSAKQAPAVVADYERKVNSSPNKSNKR